MMGLQASGATENPSPSERVLVVVISPIDLSGDLGLTVLWRSDVQRVMVTTVEAAIESPACVPPPCSCWAGWLRPWRARCGGCARTRPRGARSVLCPQSDLDQGGALRGGRQRRAAHAWTPGVGWPPRPPPACRRR